MENLVPAWFCSLQTERMEQGLLSATANFEEHFLDD